jgi:uncharacterized protein YlaI
MLCRGAKRRKKVDDISNVDSSFRRKLRFKPTRMHMSDERKGRLEKRFGHPSMTEPLFRVMIHKESVHLLGQVYAGEIERAHLKDDKGEGLALAGLDIQTVAAVSFSFAFS